MATAEENGNRNSGRKLKMTLADSSSVLDPVTETEKEMAQARGEVGTQRTSAEELLQELQKLDNLQDRQLNVFSCDNAILFFIEPEGNVETTYEKFRLTIFRIQGVATDTIFLRVGTWVYPLFSELSPCYRSSEGLFIFPDIHSKIEGATVGILLPKEECEALHEVLSELLGNQEDGRSRRSVVGDEAVSVSLNINRGSSYLSRNMVRASESLAGCLDSATARIVGKMQPGAMYIDPNVQKAAQVAYNVSGNVAGATRFLSSSLGNALTALGRYISPYVSNYVKEGVPKEAVQFTANTFQGIGNIYNGLEQSAEILANSLSHNAVKIAEHRYGEPVGHVTRDVLSTIGNIYAARRNVTVWKPKSIAKATMRSVGQAMLEDRREHLRQQHQ